MEFRKVISVSKPLATFLRQQAKHVQDAMQQQVGEELNGWLLDARTYAKEIARQKLEQARGVLVGAQETSGHQEDMIRVIRQNWNKPLKDIVDQVVAQRENVNPFETTQAGGLRSPFGTNESKGRGGGFALSNLDFTTLYRCRYLYSRLDKSDHFAEKYREQRGLQLKSDLERRVGQASGSFYDQISDSMERVIGFLIIEDRVLHTGQGIIELEDIHAMWEEALQVLLDRLHAWLESGKNFLSEATSICSHLALSCTVLAHYGLDIDPLKQFTHDSVEMYGKTLQKECTQWIGAICSEDLSRKLPPLPVSREGGNGGGGGGEEGEHFKPEDWYLDPEVSAEASRYSACVPEVVNLLLGLLKDSLSFVEGIRIGEDLTFPFAYFDDDSVSQVLEITGSIVNLCLLPCLKEMIQDERNDLAEATQLMADIYFGFIPALHGLEPFVSTLCSSHNMKAAVEKMREASNGAFRRILLSPEYVAKGQGEGKEGEDRGGGGNALPPDMLDLLYEVMDLSEENVLEILCAKVDSYSANYIMMDWCPRQLELVSNASGESPRTNPSQVRESECVTEIVGFINKMSRDSKKCMPSYLHKHLFSQLFQHAADHILQLLSCSAVSRFNLMSIVQLNTDLHFLKKVAASTLEDSDVDVLFSNLMQVLEYLLSCIPESILDPQVKMSLYPLVNTQMLGRLLCKYQEMPKDVSNSVQGSGMSFLSNAPTKATIDGVVEKLLNTL